ncbi:class I adenylate-forming enzyme family protein [Streptomyces sp. NPDC051218]|uniref:class I adenylate-forming enzyme family protein n=1 Tax=Streptomyces sp. NPDC051218 TaxID=3365645 RepID=UPI0037A08E3F
MAFQWGQTIERRTSGVPYLVYTPRRTQVAQLLQDAEQWGGRTHLVQGGRRLTFAEMFREVDRVAGILHAHGLRPGDRLLLLAPNSVEWVVALWAGFRLGAVVTLGNSWWSSTDIAYAVDLVRPAVIVADRDRLALLPAGARGIDVASLAPGEAGPPALAPAPPAPPAGHEDDPAVIIFTAGTTGHPKAVVLAHRSILANLHNLLAVSRRLPHQIDADRSPAVSLQSGPLFHIGGLQSLMLSLLGGNTVVFLKGRYDPGEVLDLIEGEGVTVWGAIPTMAARVLDHPSLPRRDLSTVRSISMGGTPVQPQLLARLRQFFPNAKRGLSTVYGMTETGGTLASASGTLMAAHPTTAGKPLPVVELRIDQPDAEGNGEIVVRTPGQLLGYWDQGRPEILDDDGFVHTGDLGRLADGLLYVTGRIKDLIIRGGENIAPAHVEAALLKHPAVVNAAVIGRPDEDLGERVAAMVQLAEGESLAPSELAAHAAPMLAKFEVPADWWICAEPLPMTDAGKTDKRTIDAIWPTD